MWRRIYLRNPWRGVLLDKLTVSQLVKKFPEFYAKRKFITAFISARHLFLYWASSTQPIPTTFDSLKIHLNITLPSTSGSPKWSLSLRFPHQKTLFTPLPHTRYIPRPSHSTRFYHPVASYSLVKSNWRSGEMVLNSSTRYNMHHQDGGSSFVPNFGELLPEWTMSVARTDDW